jgi:glycerol-3-phosphate acyltransferase PlsX
MKIGVDIMGGDNAPEAVVLGAIHAREQLPADVELVLIGDQRRMEHILAKHEKDTSLFRIVHTDEYIGMGDNPAKAISKKSKSSITIGFQLLKEGKIDGFASAGNTGAMFFASMYSVKSIPGVIRPCLSTFVPVIGGRARLLLDVGINPDCKPDVLYQYGILGSLYIKLIYRVNDPKVALLNIGAEEEKGNLLTKSAYQLMKDASEFNFAGNIEGNELFTKGKADVIVTDGFVGNVVIKEAEAFYGIIKAKNLQDNYFEQFNFENYGGTPILGINKPVVIGHGISNEFAIKNMIVLTKDIVEKDLSKEITAAFN